MTSIKPPGDSLPDNLPLLTEVASEHLSDDLPTLTEIVAEGQDGAARETPPPEVPSASCMPDDEKMRQLLRRLEARLENAFAHKLGLRLEQLHHQAVEQVIGELKAELPQLLRDALKMPDNPR